MELLVFCLSLFFSFLLLIKISLRAEALGNDTDRLALLAFKAQINDDPSQVLTSWNDSLHFCHWSGVTCSRRHPLRVVALKLSRHSLVGILSSHLANLTFLRSINLSENYFHGEIPQDFGRLLRLRYIYLFSNSLEGEIPANLTSCKELKQIWLNRNYLQGAIPMELGSLPKLTNLGLGNNNFTGRIPPSFGNLTFLTVLFLDNNGLEGSIPEEFGQINNIVLLAIGVNRLSGMIPPSLYNLSSMETLALEANDLQGQFPPDLGLTLPNLQWITVGGNYFSGSIPVSLANASSLGQIDFSINQFSGSVPMNLGNLKGLWRLNFENNRLTSEEGDGLSFITSLTNCSLLESLSLYNNSLSGELPASVANLSTQMTKLNLGQNKIFGTIPMGIENLVALYALSFYSNFLTGNIPVGIGKLRNLNGLSLDRNRLSGHIPSSLGNITRLNLLYLSDNQLDGGIPSSFENFEYLQSLYLDGNQLNGSIPERVMSLLPSMIDFIASSNLLTGSLPSKIGNMESLQLLNISNNRLTGEIPITLGNCLDLRVLSMSGNFFHGSIPPTLTTLKYIESIDLSRNNLSGRIPRYLETFSFLLYLNLSFNDFEGEVPKQGVFRNASTISVAGNKKLCGGVPNLHLHTCPKLHSKKHHPSVVILLVTSASLFSLCSCTFGILYWLRRLRKKPASTTSSMKGPHLNVSYAELLKATDGFAHDHLIGVGGSGSVYKGSLENIEEVVAVKILNLQLRGASTGFMRECQVLRKIRHRNLVKLLTVCSSIDFTGNDFKALVMEYMPNGCLEKWLHQMAEEEHQLINLNFIQRLNIAIDVASALDYLHNHYDVPVVHRDLKPSNVLLDDDMVARVSDFGLAKFLLDATSNFSENQTSTVAVKGTVGYIAPEYGTGASASTHGDVYSYGVLLLEMFTGRKPTDNTFKDNNNLHQFAKLAWPDRVLEIVDPRLLSDIEPIVEREIHRKVTSKMQQCLVSVIKIGIACSIDSPSERMDMGSVVTEMHAARNLFQRTQSNGKENIGSLLDEGPSYLSYY